MRRSFRTATRLGLGIAVVLAGLAFTFAPGLVSAPNALVQGVGSCSPRQSAITELEPEAAAALADSIWSNPDEAGCVLEIHSMDAGDLERLMEEIAADPELSERYARARRLGRRISS